MKRYLILSLVLLLSVSAFAQTLPTATIAGKVLVDDVGVPGVTVTLTSPNLQGSRTTVTTAQGDYIVPFLPPDFVMALTTPPVKWPYSAEMPAVMTVVS